MEKGGLIKDLEREVAGRLLTARSKAEAGRLWDKGLTELKAAGVEERTEYALQNSTAAVRKHLKSRLNAAKYELHARREKWFKEVVISGFTTGEQKLKTRDYNALNKKTLSACKTLLSDAMQRLQSWDYKDLMVALGLLTGRRTVELVEGGAFRPVRKSDCKDSVFTYEQVKEGDYLFFTAQAKKKGKAVGYIIPVLGDYKAILKAAERLQNCTLKLRGEHSHISRISELSGVDNSGKHKILEKGLNRAAKKFLASFTGEKVTMHDSRKIYANICLNRLSKAQDESVFLREILGHENVEMGVHYRTWII